MLSTIINFEKAKRIINDIEDINLKNGNSLISIYEIESQISLWELAKPIINIHILPGIISNNKSYSLFNITLRWIYSSIKFQKLTKKKESSIELSETKNVFVCFTRYIEQDILNPIKESNDKFSFMVLSDFNNESNNTINILNYWQKNYDKQRRSIKRNLSTLKNVYNFIKIIKEIKSKNINFFDLIKIHIWLSGYFLNKYVDYIILAKKFSEKNKIKNLIEFDISDPKSRIFALYAKKNQINLVTIQFAFYYRDSYEWFYCISDKILTWGQWFDEIFINYYGINYNKIKIVGSPRFDKYLSISTQIESLLSSKSVLIISSYDIPTYRTLSNTMPFKIYIEKVIDILIKNNYKIFIKTHPLEIDTLYLNKYITNDVKIINSSEFEELLRNVNFVISHGSSLTFSALILNKPILYPTNKNIVWWDDVFANNNLGVGFDSFQHFEDLINNIELIKSQSNSQKHLVDSFIYFDKNESATNKIFKLIE